MVRRTTMPGGQPGPLAEIAVDLRQADAGRLPEQLAHALQTVRAGTEDDSVYLDEFAPWRDSIIWRFNKLFWQWLTEWEAASGRGFEAALPSGSSDANHPQAIADSVAEFWRLLKELDARGISCRRRSSRSRLASAPARAPRRGSTASRRSTSRRAPGITASCASGSGTTRPRRSSAR